MPCEGPEGLQCERARPPRPTAHCEPGRAADPSHSLVQLASRSFQISPLHHRFVHNTYAIPLKKKKPSARIAAPSKISPALGLRAFKCSDGNVNFDHGFILDSDASHTFDFNPSPTAVLDPSPVLNFGSGLAFDSNSALRIAFNSDSPTNHSSYFNESGASRPGSGVRDVASRPLCYSFGTGEFGRDPSGRLYGAIVIRKWSATVRRSLTRAASSYFRGINGTTCHKSSGGYGSAGRPRAPSRRGPPGALRPRAIIESEDSFVKDPYAKSYRLKYPTSIQNQFLGLAQFVYIRPVRLDTDTNADEDGRSAPARERALNQQLAAAVYVVRQSCAKCGCGRGAFDL
ncbi:hypothetical protein EVAR_66023_1 [Eumeta japonica]|uniref:Uncharacterized protein n=1 Tax=Eumeta variegata TaxID=151549 RepID=A0A4C1Z9G0_EUMVA|nr:hypothetical protein EVAR_66023_1 [Eumeta japonica]